MTAPRLLAGASGYSFKEWKGIFYPEKIKPEDMLAWYAARLPTVEINNTFYQMPKVPMLQHWADVTPESFRFAIKASRRITHVARINAEAATDSVGYLYKSLAALGRAARGYRLAADLRLLHARADRAGIRAGAAALRRGVSARANPLNASRNPAAKQVGRTRVCIGRRAG